MEDASRLGICIADEDGRIRGFEEKPKKPKSDKASMGIYIFNTDTLFEYLSVDEDDEDSQNDFGKNVLPNLLHSGERLFAYDFSGYWRDVGTLYSLWEANMDLVLPDPPLDLSGKYMRIYTKNDARCPQFIGEGSSVKNSLVAEGCRIFGSVEGSVISAGAVIEEGASVTDSVVMEDAYILSGVVLDRVIVDRGARIESGVYSSKDPFDICVIGNETMNKGERQNG
jgi:glucose-1-phosphate adenylyltransferase